MVTCYFHNNFCLFLHRNYLTGFHKRREERKAKAKHELDEKLKQKVKEERKKVFPIFTDAVQLHLENRRTSYFAPLSPCTEVATDLHANKSFKYSFNMLYSSVFNYRRVHFAVFGKLSI